MPSGFVRHCRNKVVDRVAQKAYTLKALTGVMVHYCLGCGQNGCAFRVDDDLVLKVSVHPGEAPIARILKGLGRPWPFLPIFHGAWTFPPDILGWPADGEEFGVTLREDLVDFSPDRPREFMDSATDFLKAASNATSLRLIQELRRDLLQTLGDMTTFDANALRMIADFAVWSVNYGLGFDLMEFSGPLSIANLGHSLEDDAVVVRDLGNFDPTRGSLDRLRKATLRRVREAAR